MLIKQLCKSKKNYTNLNKCKNVVAYFAETINMLYC